MVLLGNILEAYDYALYGYFAPILAHQFFPTSHPFSGLLLTFTVFALGFITRPLGAAIFGHYGDKYGRKKTLMLAIVLMALPTTLIGLLPSYHHIGITAGILLALCRLIQGFAVGAEFVGAMIYMVEYAQDKRRIFYGSLSISSGYFAMLFTAVLVSVCLYCIPQAYLQASGWRIPFLLGTPLGLIALYIRSKLPETAVFTHLLATKEILKNPLLEILKTKPLVLSSAIGLTMLHTLGFYLLFIYFSTYLNLYHHLSTAFTALANSVSLLVGVIALPCIGLIAEKKSPQRFMRFSAIGFILLAYPCFTLLPYANFLMIMLIQSFLTILLCLFSATLPAVLADLFPPSLRYTGMGLSYNISAVLFGGTAPLVLSFMVEKTNNLAFPGIYLMLAASVSLLSLIFLYRIKVFSPLYEMSL